jgi:xylulokinase
VLVDVEGIPVRPAQCFPDGRATGQAANMTGAAAGTWGTMNAFHPLARLCWVRENDPLAWARTRFVLQPKDFLGFRLTGVPFSDAVSNAWLLDRATGARTDAPLRRANIDAALLPPFSAPDARIGLAKAPARLAGIPVFAGAMDTWIASVGAGVGRAGDAYLISGTTDAGGVLTSVPKERPGLVTLPWGSGTFHTGGPSGAGADCLAWAADMLGFADAAEVAAAAADVPGSDDVPICLPALAGTRAPDWQPAARGALLGLQRHHGRAHVARAIAEGVAFADRDLLGGLPHDRLVLAGGGARSDAWCQLRADVLGHAIARAPDEPGLIGAAAVAWTGLGQFASLADAQAAMCRYDRVFPARTELALQQRYATYRALSAANVATLP